MTDYRNTNEKLVFTDRMEKVREEILGRVLKFQKREDTHCSPAPESDANPFVDVFNEMPDAPYVIALAHGLVRSWMCTPFMIFKNEALVGITRPIYQVHEHFSIGVGTEGMSFGKKIGAQFFKVINFTVEDKSDGTVLIGHRLTTCLGQVDD